MKIPVIKKLVETYATEELIKAENDIIEEQILAINVEGEDEGEKLTHVIAAAWIQTEMREKNIEFKDALREYTKKVRASIS